MRPVARDVTRSVVCVSVCVLGTRVNCAKTAKPIEMPFGADSCRSQEPDPLREGLIATGEKTTMRPFATLFWTLASQRKQTFFHTSAASERTFASVAERVSVLGRKSSAWRVVQRATGRRPSTRRPPPRGHWSLRLPTRSACAEWLRASKTGSTPNSTPRCRPRTRTLQ